MGIRRYSCFLFQLAVGAYIIGALFYVIRRNTSIPLSNSSPKLSDTFNHVEEDITRFNPHVTDQPDSYTIEPEGFPFKERVALPPATNTTERQAAAFIVLVRNSELASMLQSMHDIEDTFNHKFNYPWIFLNEQPFTEEFVKYTTNVASSKTHYGFVNESMWGYPDWIDQAYAAQERERQSVLPYGSSESYRHMCRFQSGFFWRHPLVLSLNLEYYWRVEPDVRYYCKLDYDPFLYMKQNKKKYAFNISFVEHIGTVPGLWKTIKKFVALSVRKGKNYFPHRVDETIFNFVTADDGESYNGCHFWTNFEIARLDLWHTEAYQAMFNFLDRSGGFFYERWGDAPVHSIFASLFLKKDEIHFFNDIGYKHSIYEHCPAEDSLVRRCSCDPASSLDFKDQMSCLIPYFNARNTKNDKRTVNDMLMK